MTDKPIRELAISFKNLYSERGLADALKTAVKYTTPAPYDTYVRMCETEYTNYRSVPLPIRTRIKLLRDGFQSNLYYLYQFHSTNTPERYVSTFDRLSYTGKINGDPDVLNHKDVFYRRMLKLGYREHVPKQHGKIENGRYCDTIDDNILDTLEQNERIVIKKTTGGRGNDVYICESQNGDVLVNGSTISASAFEASCREFESHLVQEYVSQAAYLDTMYPSSANTARLLTMQPEDEEPFVAGAAQRIGSNTSGALDNFAQGGLSAEIDVETGTLGKAARPTTIGIPQWYTNHPDTGTRIQGTEIPGWQEILDRVLTITNDMDGVRYVGWDVLVTSPGEFVLLEGNNRSDVNVHQVHGPLLNDERVRTFYREHEPT